MKQGSPRKETPQRDQRILKRVRNALQHQIPRAPTLSGLLEFKTFCEHEGFPPMHHSDFVPYGKVCRLSASYGRYKGLWVNSKWLRDIDSLSWSYRLKFRQRAFVGLLDPEAIESDMRRRLDLAEHEQRIYADREKEKRGRDKRLVQPTEAQKRDAFIRILWNDPDIRRAKSRAREIAERLDASKIPVPKTWLDRGANSWTQAYGKRYVRPLVQKLISKAAGS